MKRMFLIFVLGILFSSCMKHEYSRVNEEGTLVTNVEHNGHKYLEFREIGQYGFSIVHDSDCECFIKE